MEKPIRIPGTLDESGIGYKDVGGKKMAPDTDTSREIYQVDQGIRTRLTRVVTYEGPASITRTLTWDVPAGKRLFVEVERSRHLTLRLNGSQVTAWTEGSVSTPWVFEVTGRMTGRDTLEMIADNSYPGWPHDAIVFSSAATDETQTNWNGLMGYVRLRVEEETYLSASGFIHGKQPGHMRGDRCPDRWGSPPDPDQRRFGRSGGAPGGCETRRGGAVVPRLTPGGECPALG